MRFFHPILLPTLLLVAALATAMPTRAEDRPASVAAGASNYTRTTPSPDGTGIVYLGREVAQVMGHAGASWLERPERVEEERTDLLLADLRRRLADKPTAVVADIGAGSGYFSLRLAELLPRGRILAEDIEEEMLALIRRKQRALGKKAGNVETILGTTTDPKLPANGVDLVLLVDTYHEWDHPREMMAAIVRALKPGGRVVQLEYRAEDPTVQILPHHKMSVSQARREMEAAGLRWVETRDELPQQHLLVFEKSSG